MTIDNTPEEILQTNEKGILHQKVEEYTLVNDIWMQSLSNVLFNGFKLLIICNKATSIVELNSIPMATCRIMANWPGRVLMSVVRLRHLPPRWYCCYCSSENFLPASSETVFEGYKCWDRQENCNSLSSTIPVQDLTAALHQYCLYCNSVSGLF